MSDARDFDRTRPRGGDFFHKGSGAEFVLGEVFDVGDGFAAGGFADEFDFVPLDVFDAHDVHLFEEVEGIDVDGVTEDGFLNKEDVAFGGFDLFDKVEDVGAFFFDDFVHLSVVVDHYCVFHLDHV